MRRIGSHRQSTARRVLRTMLLCGVVSIAFSTVVARAAVPLTVISNDPYTNATSYHQTEVEPDTLAVGSTLVSAFQAGRSSNGGASNIGWATTTNGGSTWTKGFLPGTTAYSTPAGPYAAVTDSAVAFDPKHGVWLIVSNALDSSNTGIAVIVNRSTNGALTWSNPVTVQASSTQDMDKTWIVCDTHSGSPYYGNC